MDASESMFKSTGLFLMFWGSAFLFLSIAVDFAMEAHPKWQ